MRVNVRQIAAEIRRLSGHFFALVVKLAQVNFSGWKNMLTETARLLGAFIVSFELVQLMFLISLFAAAFSALLPWIEYTVDLNGRENVMIGSRLKIIFLLPSIAGVLMSVIDWRWRMRIFYGSLLTAGVAYIGGFFLPQIFHSALIRREDYSFTPWIYLYGALLAVSGALSRSGMKKPLLEPARIFQKLVMPAPAFQQAEMPIIETKGRTPAHSSGKNYVRRSGRLAKSGRG